MTKKYDELDARILACIARGKATLASVTSECSSAAWLVTRMGRPAWRTIERRLQVLRKAGKIEHANPWWKIVEEKK